MGSITKTKIEYLEYGNSISGDSLHIKKLVNSTSFYAQFTIDGNRVHKLLGKSSDGYNLSRARIDVNRLRSEIQDQGANTQRKIKPMKFSDAADEYIKTLKSTNGNGIPQKEQQLRDHLKPAFGKLFASHITSMEVECFRSQRLKNGATPATINREISTLDHLYSQMKKWQFLGEKPYDIDRLEENNERIVCFSDDECRRLIEASKSDVDAYSKLFVFIGLNTAMRHAEILSMHYDNINFETKRLFIPEAKSGGRYQPLTDEIVHILKEHKIRDADNDNHSGWVFSSSTSTTGHRTYMTKQFGRILTSAGLCTKMFSPHAMRHTCISRLVRNNVNLNTVMKISGHKTLTMVMRYTHIADNQVDDAIETASIGWSE